MYCKTILEGEPSNDVLLLVLHIFWHDLDSKLLCIEYNMLMITVTNFVSSEQHTVRSCKKDGKIFKDC